jgi:hypothetical protein
MSRNPYPWEKPMETIRRWQREDKDKRLRGERWEGIKGEAVRLARLKSLKVTVEVPPDVLNALLEVFDLNRAQLDIELAKIFERLGSNAKLLEQLLEQY